MRTYRRLIDFELPPMAPFCEEMGSFIVNRSEISVLREQSTAREWKSALNTVTRLFLQIQLENERIEQNAQCIVKLP